MESRSIKKLNMFHGAKDAWRDWALVPLNYTERRSHQFRMRCTCDDASVKDPCLVKDGECLRHMLTQLLAGAPLDIVLIAGGGGGLETSDYGVRPATSHVDGRIHHGNLALPFSPPTRRPLSSLTS